MSATYCSRHCKWRFLVKNSKQLAERLNVSRQAITKWETNKGIPDIANLIAISDEFGLSLDELIKDDVAVKKKIITDSSAKKWHILMIVYLVAIVAYIVYFVICHKILMIGFLVATLFMLFFELRIFMMDQERDFQSAMKNSRLQNRCIQGKVKRYLQKISIVVSEIKILQIMLKMKIH